ncbi:hypothetical protein EOM82_04515 [bacterium]|nr:hypothetical protein [bacterium]
MKYIKGFFYYLIQFTWGFLQNFTGFLIFLKFRKEKRIKFFGSIITLVESRGENWGGISFGCFIFVNALREKDTLDTTCVHEYGHTIQSLILGPLYFFVVGLPSFIWCNSKKYRALRKETGVSYFSRFPENSANKWGERVTKMPAPQK